MLESRRVSRHVVEMLVRAADGGGVLRSDFAPRARTLDWEDFVRVLHQLEARMGFERLAEVCAQLPDVSPSSRKLLSLFVSPRLLVRFVNELLGPSSYPMLETKYVARGDEGHLQLRLREGLSGSHVAFRIFAVGVSAAPLFIGAPPLPVRAQTHARGGDYWFTLPPDEGLRGRARRGVVNSTWQDVLAAVQEDKQRFLDANEAVWRQRGDALSLKLAAAQRAWSLTPRHVDVLSGLARGLSNKALVEELGCSVKTVETHITELLKRSGADSRLALVATFWREL